MFSVQEKTVRTFIQTMQVAVPRTLLSDARITARFKRLRQCKCATYSRILDLAALNSVSVNRPFSKREVTLSSEEAMLSLDSFR